MVISFPSSPPSPFITVPAFYNISHSKHLSLSHHCMFLSLMLSLSSVSVWLWPEVFLQSICLYFCSLCSDWLLSRPIRPLQATSRHTCLCWRLPANHRAPEGPGDSESFSTWGWINSNLLLMCLCLCKHISSMYVCQCVRVCVCLCRDAHMVKDSSCSLFVRMSEVELNPHSLFLWLVKSGRLFSWHLYSRALPAVCGRHDTHSTQ